MPMDVSNGAGSAHVRQDYMGNLSTFDSVAQFCCEPKTAPGNKEYFFKLNNGPFLLIHLTQLQQILFDVIV